MATAKAQNATEQQRILGEHGEQLEREIAELNHQLAKLQADCDRGNSQISERLAEQRTLVVAARVRKDKEAQSKVDQLSDDIRLLQDSNLQNYAAIEELKATIEARQQALERGERRARYGAVLALIQSRLEAKLESQLLQLALELKDVAERLRMSDAEISAALRPLGGDFLREGMEFPYRERNRRNAVTELLKDAIDPRAAAGGFAGNPPADAATAFGRLAEMLGEKISGIGGGARSVKHDPSVPHVAARKN